MSKHEAILNWQLQGDEFLQGRYSREHTWTFDGGITLPASPAPTSVPAPFSNPAHVDPEEAFVAAVASCHLLTFLYLAYRAGILVTAYQDHPVGEMTKNERGVPWVSRITLHPVIQYAGPHPPDAATESRLHHAAHEQCYLANSIRTEVVVAPRPIPA